MPELPSLGNLPQVQFDKIVASFPGATLAEKAQAYKDWSVNRLIDRVEQVEFYRAQAAIQSSLPARPPEPPTQF